MEPRIRYAKTSDGVNIAFATAGDGPPLLVLSSFPWSHVQAIWDMFAHLYQPLAERFHLVWYDYRGTGLSDRVATDFSLDAMARDVEAVIESAGLTRFAMVARFNGVPIAVTYAAMRPEKISSLVLADGWMTFADFSPAAIVAEEALRSGDWAVYTETLARLLLGFENHEFAARYAAYIRECIEPEVLRSALLRGQAWDVSGLLPQVSAQTLVVHNRNNRFLPVQAGQRLAARIPNARFQLVDEQRLGERLPGIITGFLGESDEIAQRQADVPSGTAIILFADIADSTALTERLGDKAFREKARDLDTSLRAIIREHSGTCIDAKTLGDGVLATFASAAQAIEAALACGEAGDDATLPLHLGLHAGDVIREEKNVFGGAVNIASRISGLSAPGEVLVSDTLRGLARTSAGVNFEDRGEREMKGVGEPMRVWAVRKA